MSDILDTAVLAATSAGDFLAARFGKIHEIERKPDHSLVTDVDKHAEEIVVTTIREKFPGHGIFGEERGIDARNSDYLWIIDPLDGTHNFIRNIPLYGVSIGVWHSTEYIAGVMYLPSNDELYAAEKGSGTWKNGNRISVSPTGALDEASMTFDSSLRTDSELKVGILNAMFQRVFNVRMFGSSARNLTWIAEGKLDLLIEFDDHVWDFAAGVCLIQEAGGRITDFNGNLLDIRDGQRYIASNNALHEKVMGVVRGKDSNR